MTYQTPSIPDLDDEQRREFLKVLGVGGAALATTELTMGGLRSELGGSEAGELAAMGEQIRADLSGELELATIEAGVADLEAQMANLGAIREMGVPPADSTAYQEVAAPGWEIYEHLLSVGFFESAEQHLPEFTAEHVGATSRELVRAEPLSQALAAVGLSESERVALTGHIATNNEWLALWVPTKNIPSGVEFDVSKVAPLHQRALGGALLWTDYLDTYLWQKEVLMTEAILDHAVQHMKTMFGGAELLATAAKDIAGAGELADSQLTAALTGGAAALILGQQDLTQDVIRITEDMRAPSTGGVN